LARQKKKSQSKAKNPWAVVLRGRDAHRGGGLAKNLIEKKQLWGGQVERVRRSWGAERMWGGVRACSTNKGKENGERSAAVIKRLGRGPSLEIEKDGLDGWRQRREHKARRDVLRGRT